MKKSRTIYYYIGNFLLLGSILGVIVIFAPLLNAYLPQDKSAIFSTFSYTISIPKIDAISPIILNVDPWNEQVYKEALRHGVAHALGSSVPGGTGGIYLFAHSSGLPWEVTRYNTIFLRLGELGQGDTILLKWGNKEFSYKVYAKKIVSPSEVEYLIQQKKETLIIQTCTPIGTDLNRLLIFASPRN